MTAKSRLKILSNYLLKCRPKQRSSLQQHATSFPTCWYQLFSVK